MLYCRDSALYWLRLLPRSILNLTVLRLPEPQRLGLITEGKPKYADQACPITRVYSRLQLMALLRDYGSVEVRKGGFDFSMLFPAGGWLFRHAIMRLLGVRPAGSSTILYGQPVYPSLGLEQWLGRWLGFDWNISARKY
jgi:hypothetical protein